MSADHSLSCAAQAVSATQQALAEMQRRETVLHHHRKAFEAACWQKYLDERARRKIDGDVEGDSTPERMFWRRADGTYGVAQFNAAWWGYKAGVYTTTGEKLEG